jgi:Bax protein
MPAIVKPIALAVALLIAFLFGAFYQPTPSNEEAALGALPVLPGWADAQLPDFTTYEDTAEKKAAFFSFLYPRIVLANTRVLLLRENLDALRANESLSEDEQAWLKNQAERLRVDAEGGSSAMFSELETRLDIVPPSLVLAQAANESAWGTSRFATKGNNLFGQWCFSKGCGLVPASRNEGASHEVADFQSPYQSIRAYITNLNRHPTYAELRQARTQARDANRFPDGVTLAQGLLGYSERGAEYVKEIRGMIRYNNLAYFDNQYQTLVNEDSSPPELMQLATSDEAPLLPKQKQSEEG